MKKEAIIDLYPLDWSETKIEDFRQALLNWYDENKRDLPWRLTHDPYSIWVSEIMLQQTQVDTVIPYYERFLEKLPTIADLAAADETTIMSLWQGLGYYSRVRNMQAAAIQIMKDHQGEMPGSLDQLLSLKGIGPYTAGAIASMAFGLPEPALDGNLMRIVARMFEIDGDITKVKTKRVFMAILYQLIDPDRPGDFNQAMMDLGATVMTPTNYQPEDSPIKEFDLSYQKGTSHLYPVKKAAKKSTHHYFLGYAISRSDGKMLLRKHQKGELLKDLWHFPLIEQSLVMESASEAELIEPLSESIGIDSDPQDYFQLLPEFQNYGVNDKLVEMLPPINHIFSHRVWHVQIIPLQTGQLFDLPDSTYQWVGPDEFESYPLSTLQRKLFQHLTMENNVSD